MNDKFVPFALPGKPAGDSGNGTFRLKVLPSAEGSSSSTSSTAASSSPSSAPSVAPSAAGSASPEVKLERDAQQRISRIRVQCTCGQAHELDCSYE